MNVLESLQNKRELTSKDKAQDFASMQDESKIIYGSIGT
jgi:hypothetical protein